MQTEATLTELEREVLRRAAAGLSVRATAEALQFSASYVREVRAGAMRKLETVNVTAAVAVAMSRGLL